MLDLSAELAVRWRLDRKGLSAPRGHFSARGNAIIAERIAAHLGQIGI